VRGIKGEQMPLEDIEVKLRQCSACQGSGSNQFTNEDCDECVGTGFVPYGVRFDKELTDEEYITLIREILYQKKA